jgi:hydrocephalus-inducing protein
LVGIADEPEVYFEKTHINFSSLLVSRKAQEVVYIINKEEIPFSFQLDKSSISLEEKILEISPMKETVRPNGRIPVTITFNPNAEKKYNFTLLFNVKRKTNPLSLNVKGEGYAIRDTMQVESDEGLVSNWHNND